MKKRNRTDHQAFISGELYLFHPTDRSCSATGSLFGIFDKIADGILYLESSSSDLIHFRLWHRLPDDYSCCRRASHREHRDYFFNLAPFTLALGVINPFARAFGHRKLERCPYLVTRARNVQTAEEWAGSLLDTADRMDEKLRQMQIDRWIPVRLRRRRK